VHQIQKRPVHGHVMAMVLPSRVTRPAFHVRA
jgi:hypothetical protein